MTGLGIVTGLAAELRCLCRAAHRSPTKPHMVHAAGDPAAAAVSLVEQGVGSLMSFGIAGGLDPVLAPGRVIVGRRVLSGRGASLDCDAAWRDSLMQSLNRLSPVAAALAGSDSPLATVTEKRALYDRCAAAAVDMESHEIARVARDAGLPFAAIRTVADPAHRALPSAALAGLGDRGETLVAPVLWELARHPGQLPGLIGVALDSRKAIRALERCAALLFGGG